MAPVYAGGGCSSLLVRRNGEYHHGDVLGNKGVITDGSGNVLSSNVYDAFGVSMFTSGSAQTPYRPAGLVLDVEGLDFSGPPVACPLYANRALALSEEQCGGKPPQKRPNPPSSPLGLLPILLCLPVCWPVARRIPSCWAWANKVCAGKHGKEKAACIAGALAFCLCGDSEENTECIECGLCLVGGTIIEP
ncbi:MAG TPA: hypothetical protein VKV29_00705 [Chthonomonas sp.]|uniref:hypothetical protein n=1 Tax=Chthonomonas sp. TaxID=2282153 RepID=UPI002B4B070B|nr:hypothetical protein [Chthonomonas sp.]HLH78783.1 hypothetical protein [Chthonomonas sp.]